MPIQMRTHPSTSPAKKTRVECVRWVDARRSWLSCLAAAKALAGVTARGAAHRFEENAITLDPADCRVALADPMPLEARVHEEGTPGRTFSNGRSESPVIGLDGWQV